jgi:transposase
MNEKYVVDLTVDERELLRTLVSSGSKLVRSVKRAQVLLAADADMTDEQISMSVSIGTSTIYRTKRRFVEGGINEAIYDRARPGGARKLTGKEEALLIATACTSPPSGRAKWTLELLAGEIVRLTNLGGLSRETVRRILSENDLKPWQRKMWCVPKIDGEYVARMEDVLDLYAETPASSEPVICFDESPIQLIAELRRSSPASCGRPARFDYEYRRNGTANLFVFVNAHESWRHVKVTEHRTGADFAECMRDLVDEHYPHAERIRVVLDNLSTHSAAALYQSFPPEEARRLLRRLEFHFVPKHASWLNMVEIEIGVLKNQCLDRRIADKHTLVREIAAWQQTRNESGARIRWMFSLAGARKKMGHANPARAEIDRKAA